MRRLRIAPVERRFGLFWSWFDVAPSGQALRVWLFRRWWTVWRRG